MTGGGEERLRSVSGGDFALVCLGNASGGGGGPGIPWGRLGPAGGRGVVLGVRDGS